MRTLEVVNEHDVIDQQALQEYAQLFEQPLSESHIKALAALFKWHIPEDFCRDEGDTVV